MKSRKNYSQQRLDPRWQKRRLEIMQRDDFTCADCGATDRTLNVHHIYYTSGADIWDYPDHALVTLCEECHSYEHQSQSECEKSLVVALKHIGVRSSSIGSIAFTIEQIESHLGAKQAKEIVQMIDFIAFRPVIDQTALEKIKALFDELKPSSSFSQIDSNAKSNHS